jgi:DNA-binding PadR family transcriptional regulator
MSRYDIRMLREFLRGAAQVHVLHHAAQGEVHGAWLAVELRRHGYEISPGTLYPMLHRMEQTGLLISCRQLAEGRNRRVYTATERGRAELTRLRAAVAELADEVLVDAERPVRPPPARAAWR